MDESEYDSDNTDMDIDTVSVRDQIIFIDTKNQLFSYFTFK